MARLTDSFRFGGRKTKAAAKNSLAVGAVQDDNMIATFNRLLGPTADGRFGPTGGDCRRRRHLDPERGRTIGIENE